MAIKEEQLTSVDGYELDLLISEAKSPKAVIQMVHGMEEHKERYVPFMEYLSKNGYTCVISDLRGHGKNAPILSHISNKRGDKLLIQDQIKINSYIKSNYKGLPIYLFGHSMGTIISRVLIQEEGKRFAKVALSGYVNPNPIAPIGVGLVKCLTIFKGPKAKSKLMDNMTTGSFNNPLCGVPFTLGSYYTLMKLLARMGKYKAYKAENKDCPIYLISGQDDPCTGLDKGREDSKALLVKAGYNNIEVKTLENMRHEILNEDKKEEVYASLLEFFNK